MTSLGTLEQANLPPLHRFHRPLWAYEILGWPLLREHLFGQTWKLLERLEALGDALVSPEEMAAMFDDANLPMIVRSRIGAAKPGKTAREIAACYRRWEDEVFEAYLARERSNEKRMLGK